MIIYEKEKKIENIIRSADKSVSNVVLPVRVTENKDDLLVANLEHAEKLSKELRKAFAKIAKYDHPDLLFGSAILASTVVNKNDDVFLPEEMWAARDSAINIPYNDQHMEREIIGHTIASRPLDSEGQLIESEDAPDYFDLEVDFVMYQSIFPSLAEEILTDAPLGKKFVSMECRFPDFDYALEDSKGSIRVIKRTESTAFLTKHLRILGGDGNYQGDKVYRVLRNFRFIGVGNVDTPANPKSEYTRFDAFEEVSSVAEISESNKKVFFFTKGNIMEIETVDQAKELLTQANTEISQLKDKLKEYEGQEVQQLRDAVAALTTEKEQLVTQATQKEQIVKDQLVAVQAELTTLKTELDTVKAELQTKTEALNQIESEKKTLSRVQALKDAGVERTAEAVKAWSEETFAAILDFAKTSKPADPVTDDQAGTSQANDQLGTVKEGTETDLTKTGGDDQTANDDFQKSVATIVANIQKKNSKKK